MQRIKDITNKSFGRWKVISFSHTKKVGNYTYQMWNCICKCGTKNIVEGKSLRQGRSVSCGCFCKERTPRGENHYAWKGDEANYQTIHKWLRRTFGNANKCESKNCRQISKNFHYALIKGKEYERKRENFMQLCRSCHLKYDFTEQWRKNISKSLLGNKHNLGNKASKETRLKMSLVRLGKKHKK